MIRSLLATLALAVAVVPVAAGPADAATKHRKAKTTKTAAKKRAAAKQRAVAKPTPAPAVTAAPAATPAPAATAPVTSVISIGGYTFYNLTYAEAVDAYTAAVAAAPAGYTPPPVNSVSVTVTVGGTS